MTRYVYIVNKMPNKPHGFTSDWQDHRTFELHKAFSSKTKALECMEILKRNGYYVNMNTLVVH